MSFHTVHNEMLRRHPELLPRLYRPFHWNRQREHAPDEPLTYQHPIFSYDGVLRTRFNRRLIKVGHEIADAPLDAEGADALDAMVGILEDPTLPVEFVLEPGPDPADQQSRILPSAHGLSRRRRSGAPASSRAHLPAR
ncbi:MAG: hypothetical protein WDO24_24560 [Pseudomonadota bacterium]